MFANLHELLDFEFSPLSFFFSKLLFGWCIRLSQFDHIKSADVAAPGQVALLQEERNSLLAENDVLTDRANQLDTFEDPSTPSGRKHSQLQQQLESLQEENFRLSLVEVQCHDLRLLWKARMIL